MRNGVILTINAFFAGALMCAASASELKDPSVDGPKINSFKKYVPFLHDMTKELDPKSLYAVALTEKAGTDLVARELKARIPKLVTQFQITGNFTIEGKSINNFFQLGHFNAPMIAFIPEAFNEFLLCAKPILSVTLLYNNQPSEFWTQEDCLGFGLQATNMIVRNFPHKDRQNFEPYCAMLEPFYCTHENEESSAKISYLKEQTSSTLIRLCQSAMPQDPTTELFNMCHSLIATIKMQTYPRTFEDVRIAANSLLQIGYFRDYPSEQHERVLLELQNGPLEKVSGAPAHFYPMQDNEERSIEAKAQDFDLLRQVYLHAMNDLALDEVSYEMGYNCKTWKAFKPALINDTQAELFKKRDLNSYFK